MPSGSANKASPGPFPCQDELIELFEVLVNVMFCMKNTDSRYLAVNGTFVRRTGRSSKREVIGRRAFELFSAPLAERYEEQDRHVFESGRPLRDELELIRRDDGSLGWYLTTKLPVSNRETPNQVCGLVSISRDLQTPSETEMEPLGRLVEYVRDNLGQSIRVADLAAVAGCSGGQLERRMRKTFGLTPTQYILRVRVDRAARLLSDSTMPLAEVATTVGFYDQADFTRRFARLTNETPAQFRLNHR